MRLVLLFVGFFLLFASIGYLVGVSKPHDSNILLNRATFYSDIIEKNGDFQIVYHCNDEWLYQYNVDSNSYSKSINALLLEVYKDNEHFSLPKYGIDPEQLISFLGGASGAWTIRDVIKHTAKGTRKMRIKEIISSLFGAISGYALGHYLGYSPPKCDSVQMLSFLDDIDIWKKIERRMFILNLSAIYSILQKTPFIPDTEFKQFESNLKKRLETLPLSEEIKGYDFSSNDFNFLLLTTNEVKELLQPSRYKKYQTRLIVIFILWFLIGSIIYYLAGIRFLLGYLAISFIILILMDVSGLANRLFGANWEIFF